eukprot:TRINITY_DN5021_c0_g4_i2.p1 TRINITY_DN5021_c0_g4~~TRINITY_DN5021_c0_g4_i2.p1  ORF type:complete len:334 (-),score=39.43 TRINITY_DN5021_c0_g4_i2:118-1119(-)
MEMHPARAAQGTQSGEKRSVESKQDALGEGDLLDPIEMAKTLLLEILGLNLEEPFTRASAQQTIQTLSNLDVTMKSLEKLKNDNNQLIQTQKELQRELADLESCSKKFCLAMGEDAFDKALNLFVFQKEKAARAGAFVGYTWLSMEDYLSRGTEGFLEYTLECERHYAPILVYAVDLNMKQMAKRARVEDLYRIRNSCPLNVIVARSKFYYLVVNTLERYKSKLNIGRTDWDVIKKAMMQVWESPNSKKCREYTVREASGNFNSMPAFSSWQQAWELVESYWMVSKQRVGRLDLEQPYRELVVKLDLESIGKGTIVKEERERKNEKAVHEIDD